MPSRCPPPTAEHLPAGHPPPQQTQAPAISSAFRPWRRKALSSFAQPPAHGDDLLPIADHGAERDRPPPLVAGQIVMRRRALRRALERRTLDPEQRREPMQLVGIVGQQMAPFQAAPVPDRVIDVDSHLKVEHCGYQELERLREPGFLENSVGSELRLQLAIDGHVYTRL